MSNSREMRKKFARIEESARRERLGLGPAEEEEEEGATEDEGDTHNGGDIFRGGDIFYHYSVAPYLPASAMQRLDAEHEFLQEYGHLMTKEDWLFMSGGPPVVAARDLFPAWQREALD